MQSKFERGIGYVGVLIMLLCSCSAHVAPPDTATPTADVIIPTVTPQPKAWKVIGVYNADQSIMTAGFLDELHVATGGVVGQMGYSSDGGKTWLVNSSAADCRYGMDIVSPQLIWSCGGATNVRRSMDGGQTWQMLAAFGDPHTIRGPCKSASFLDEQTGWLANPNLFGTTTNGGASWMLRALPATANDIATIDTYLPGEGYLLDETGTFFYTQDDGAHWTEISRVDLGALKVSPTAYQLAAMRFSDAQHGLIVISSSSYGKDEPVLAFHTSDGGATWTSESVPVLAGPVYLARTGYLTVITGVNQLTLLKYGE